MTNSDIRVLYKVYYYIWTNMRILTSVSVEIIVYLNGEFTTVIY